MSAPAVPQSHVLALGPNITSTVRSTASPPRPPSVKTTASTSPPSHDKLASAPLAESKSTNNDDCSMASPPPHPKLPEVPPRSSASAFSPPNDASSSTMASQAPAQLALMLSNALADVDALKRALTEEKKRSSRAERLLSSFHPNASTEAGISDEQKSEHMSEGALKAVLDAEARAERAERARDDALHALHSLTAHFADFERYEQSISLRAADARTAFSRLLSGITASHPPPSSSPTLSGGGSGSPATLNLPGLPAPLPAPSASTSQTSQYLAGPGAPPPLPPFPPSTSLLSTRHSRGLSSHAAPSFGYPSSHGASHTRQGSHSSATFSSLPLPPPPSATGLGAGHVGPSAPPPSSSSSFSIPAKRIHRNRSTRGLDDGAGNEWEESKRRRVGPWDMDIDEHPNHGDQPLPYPQHQPSLSAQPTQRLYERDRVQHQQSYARNGSSYPSRYDERESNGIPPVNGNGLVRVDARELVRDAKERERMGKGAHYRARDGERKRRRSASKSSAGSSWSIDEMLLETATDGDRERREDGRPLDPRQEAQLGQYQSHVYNSSIAGPPPPSSSHPPQDNLYVEQHSKKPTSHSSQASNVPASENSPAERERPGKVPASQLVTLGPGGVVVSGGGQAAPIPPGGFPAQNTSGQRICRQCGVPGRYKDGKCVEKWGPGPEGPGTVCDRCRKKMKRVERRGTLDSATANAQQQGFLAQRQAQGRSNLQSQPTLPAPSSQSRSRGTLRTDTLLVDQNGHMRPNEQTQSTMLSVSPRSTQQHAYSRERERSRDGSSRSRTRSPAPSYRHTASVSDTRHSQASTQYSQSQSHSQGQSQGHRRAPTPPYINSISTYNDDDGDGEEDSEGRGRDADADLDVDAEIAHAASTSKGSKSRNAPSYLSPNAPRVGPNGTAYPHAPPPPRSRASSTSTSATYEKYNGSRRSSRPPTSNSKHMPLPSVETLPRSAVRRRDTQDELDEDEGDGDADADADADGSGEGDADADAEIMDAVDAAMKVEE